MILWYNYCIYQACINITQNGSTWYRHTEYTGTGIYLKLLELVQGQKDGAFIFISTVFVDYFSHQNIAV